MGEKQFNGTQKLTAGVMSIAVFFLTVYMAIVRPLSQRDDFITLQVSKNEGALRNHSNSDGHPGLMAKLAEIGERSRVQYIEVETQFEAMSNFNELQYERMDDILEVIQGDNERRHGSIEKWRESHDLRIPGVDATQTQQIKALMQRIKALEVRLNSP